MIRAAAIAVLVLAAVAPRSPARPPRAGAPPASRTIRCRRRPATRLGALVGRRLGGGRAAGRHRPRHRGGPRALPARLAALPEPAALGRSAGRRGAQARRGLYTKVDADDVAAGDIVVRVTRRGRLRQDGGRRRTLGRPVGGARHREQGRRAAQRARQPASPAPSRRCRRPRRCSSTAATLRPETSVYRVAVKKDSSLGHVRELTRDLEHLERTIAERPPLVDAEPARRGRRPGAQADRRGVVADARQAVRGGRPRADRTRAGAGGGARLAGRRRAGGRRARRRDQAQAVARRCGGRARQRAAARGRARQGGLAGRGGDGDPGRLAARALRDRARAAGGGEEGRGAGGAEALPRGRPVRSARQAAGGDRRTRAGPRARRPSRPARRCASRRRPSAAGCTARRTASASTGRSPGGSSPQQSDARNGPHRRVRDRPRRCARTARPSAARVSLVVHDPGAGEAAALAKQGRAQHVPRRQAEDAAAAACRAASASSSASARAGSQRQGEVTTVERNGTVNFLVLNASTPATRSSRTNTRRS